MSNNDSDDSVPLESIPRWSPGSRVRLWQGDLIRLRTAAVVNAANSGLWAGGGVCGALHRAAGREMEEECRGLAPCPTGEARVTKGYRLPARAVVHAVGPRGEKPELLAAAYEATLDACAREGLESVGFCCISTGIYGYPPAKAARVALAAVKRWMVRAGDEPAVRDVVFCVFLESDLEIYRALMPSFFGPEGGEPAAAAAAADAELDDDDGATTEGEDEGAKGV